MIGSTMKGMELGVIVGEPCECKAAVCDAHQDKTVAYDVKQDKVISISQALSRSHDKPSVLLLGCVGEH